MSNLIKSATKICLLCLVGGTISGLFIGLVSSEQFMALVMLVATFYYSEKKEKRIATQNNGK